MHFVLNVTQIKDWLQCVVKIELFPKGLLSLFNKNIIIIFFLIYFMIMNVLFF